MPCARRLGLDMKRKNVFLESEGDARFQWNAGAITSRSLPDSDPVLVAIPGLQRPLGPGTKLLEIGCGDRTRLSWLNNNSGCDCSGIEPSVDAVRVAYERGAEAQQGTADRPPFAEGALDVVIFGSSMYHCDREDLSRIAADADRVLQDPGRR
jgi:SAM-dependent methyltransferase